MEKNKVKCKHMLSDKTHAILLHIQTRDHTSLEYKKKTQSIYRC